MCNSCNDPNHIDFDAAREQFEENLSDMERLNASYDKLTVRDQDFANSLINGFKSSFSLSAKQWHWVRTLADRVTEIEPIYGDFKAVHVAFRIAADKLKYPKIRLMTKSDRYVELRFSKDSQTVKVFVDGWQGHGYRKYAGVIDDNLIKPFSRDRMTEEVKTLIQDLAMDPLKVAKVMANRLGVCMYCGSRLSTDASKHHGYGPTCAGNYGLPYDKSFKKAA